MAIRGILEPAQKRPRVDDPPSDATLDGASVKAEGQDVLVYTEEGELLEDDIGGPSKPTIKPREVNMSYLAKMEGVSRLPLSGQRYSNKIQRQPLHILRSFTYWLRHHKLLPEEPHAGIYPAEPSHARWIFGLLSVVENQLTGDDVHILRELARACLGLIQDRLAEPNPSSVEVQQRELAQWWIPVAAVVNIWGQRDIWMDAEEMVRKVPPSAPAPPAADNLDLLETDRPDRIDDPEVM